MKLQCSSSQAAYHSISLKNLTLSGTQSCIQISTPTGMIQLLTTRADSGQNSGMKSMSILTLYFMAHGESSQNDAKRRAGGWEALRA